MIHEDNAPSHAVARAAGFAETGERDLPPREGLPEGRYLVHHWHPGKLEAGVEPADEAGHHARIDDVGHVGLAVDDVGAGGAGAVARVLAALDADDRVLRAVRDRDRQPGEATPFFVGRWPKAPLYRVCH